MLTIWKTMSSVNILNQEKRKSHSLIESGNRKLWGAKGMVLNHEEYVSGKGSFIEFTYRPSQQPCGEKYQKGGV